MTADARYPSLQQRTVLITGGATGIGESLDDFVAQGARVGFVNIDIDAEAGGAMAARLKQAETAPLFVAADDRAMCTAQEFIVDGGWV